MATRPLSPHLQIYKPQITSMTSIFHRITGVGLVFGLVLLVAYLLAATMGQNTFGQLTKIYAHPLARLVWVPLIWAFWYQFFCTFKYLAHAAGWGMQLKVAEILGWLVWGASFLATAYNCYIIWPNILGA
jgi:succinate dehydrogenase / fumarate reductase, cytochrome b subunit